MQQDDGVSYLALATAIALLASVVICWYMQGQPAMTLPARITSWIILAFALALSVATIMYSGAPVAS